MSDKTNSDTGGRRGADSLAADDDDHRTKKAKVAAPSIASTQSANPFSSLAQASTSSSNATTSGTPSVFGAKAGVKANSPFKKAGAKGSTGSIFAKAPKTKPALGISSVSATATPATTVATPSQKPSPFGTLASSRPSVFGAKEGSTTRDTSATPTTASKTSKASPFLSKGATSAFSQATKPSKFSWQSGRTTVASSTSALQKTAVPDKEGEGKGAEDAAATHQGTPKQAEPAPVAAPASEGKNSIFGNASRKPFGGLVKSRVTSSSSANSNPFAHRAGTLSSSTPSTPSTTSSTSSDTAADDTSSTEKGVFGKSRSSSTSKVEAPAETPSTVAATGSTTAKTTLSRGSSGGNNPFAKLSGNVFGGSGGSTKNVFKSSKPFGSSSTSSSLLEVTSASSQTGMEEDKKVFECLAKVFVFTKKDGSSKGEWHERGKDTLVLTDPAAQGADADANRASRLLMWSTQTKRVMLNGTISESTTIKKQSDNMLCMSLWDAADDGTPPGMKTFSIKMKSENVTKVIELVKKRIAEAASSSSPSSSSLPEATDAQKEAIGVDDGSSSSDKKEPAEEDATGNSNSNSNKNKNDTQPSS